MLEDSIWQLSTPEQKVVLMTLLLMVNGKEKEWEWKGERYHCKAGQMVTSLEKIKEKCGDGITIQNVRTALKRFEKLHYLTNESTKHGRLITLLKWGDLQGHKESSNKQPNKELTKNSQRANKELTPNKKERKKEGKNVRESESGRCSAFDPPTIESVIGYCEEMGFIGFDAEYFVSYYTGKGWKSGCTPITDWKMYVRRWYRQDQKKQSVKTTKFLNFPQRDYDMDNLEKQLLQRQYNTQ